MYKYMHGTDENQVAYHFCFQKRVELISDGAKVIELLSLSIYIYIWGEIWNTTGLSEARTHAGYDGSA